jgi:prevent-host-death family protein
VRTVGAYEAKTRLSELLDEVSRGERITITKHGRPVAVLIPAEIKTDESRLAALRELGGFGRGRSLGDVTIRDLIEEGRRV